MKIEFGLNMKDLIENNGYNSWNVWEKKFHTLMIYQK